MIRIEVTPHYLSGKSSPSRNHYFYTFTATITNTTNEEVQIISRHYKIRDGKGNQKEIEGKGVVGEQPIIKPNESFSWTSYCPLSTATGNMRGTIFFNNGEAVEFPLTFFRSK